MKKVILFLCISLLLPASILLAQAPSVASVSGTNGTYVIGADVDITVTFAAAVTISGNPRILLETGATDRYATCAGGASSLTHTFTYTVQDGDESADLNYNSASIIELNGSTITATDPAPGDIALPAHDGGSALSDLSAIVINGIRPSVASVSGVNGTYVIGADVNLTVTFNEAVTITVANPQIILETGDTDRYAILSSSGASSTTHTFTYTVQAGDASSDLNYKSTSTLELNGSTITGANPVSGDMTLPAFGGANSLGTLSDISINTTQPTITNVTSTTNDGYFTTGNVVNVTLEFSEPVDISGTAGLDLVLETGGTDKTISYAPAGALAVDNANNLSFSYTIGGTEISSDLDYVATNSLSLTSGTLLNNIGNPLDLTLPTPGSTGSLSKNKDIVIDQVAPIADSVSSTNSDEDTAFIGDRVFINIYFDEEVTVTGEPRLKLNTGATVDTFAYYYRGSSSNKLTFVYKVLEGDNTTDLAYFDNNALEANGGTIKDQAGNELTYLAALDAPATGESLSANKSLILNGIKPDLLSIATSIDNASTYGNEGEVISIELTYDKNLNVTGIPKFQLETGRRDRYATFSDYGTAGTNRKVLVFEYTVIAGDETSSLDFKSSEITGGSIAEYFAADNYGNEADLRFDVADSTPLTDIVIDAKVPEVINVTSSKKNGEYKNMSGASAEATANNEIDIIILFDENITVNTGGGNPSLTIPNDAQADNNGTIAYTRSNADSMIFTYTIGTLDDYPDFSYTDREALSFGSALVTDGKENTALDTLPVPGQSYSLSRNKEIVIDNTTPEVDSVKMTSQEGTYGIDDQIYFKLWYPEKVYVKGKPRIVMNAQTDTTYAYYHSGSGSNNLRFKYTVVENDKRLGSDSLDYRATNSLICSANDSIYDKAGNKSDYTLPDPALSSMDSLINLDGVKPIVSAFTSSVEGDANSNGKGNIGDSIEVIVVFNKEVEVAGTPKILLETGNRDRYATYIGLLDSTDTDGNAIPDDEQLLFKYIVLEGDETSDLNAKKRSSLNGNIKDLYGNDVNESLPVNLAGDIIVDGIKSVVTKVSSSKENGAYAYDGAAPANNIIDIVVTFDDTIVVTGTPTLALPLDDDGGAAGTVVYDSYEGKTITFNYTIDADDDYNDLGYANENALSAGTSIQDTNGNDVVLELPIPGYRGSLSRSKNIDIDNTAPVIDSVKSTMNSTTTYGIGKIIYFHLYFDETVTVTGKPEIEMNTGNQAYYHSGKNTNRLKFKYVVQEGDNVADLDYASADAITVGSIQDEAGNAITYTGALANPLADGMTDVGAIIINGVRGLISSIASVVDNGTVGNAGDSISITLTLDKEVEVAGTPRIQLETGRYDRYATYVGLADSTDTDGNSVDDDNELIFKYIVQEGDTTSSLKYKSYSSLTSGSIKDLIGNEINDSLPAWVSNDTIDANPPEVTKVTTIKPNGSYKYILGDATNNEIFMVFEFDQDITVAASPNLALAMDAGLSGSATFIPDSTKANSITFKYIIDAADNCDDFDYGSSNALTMDAGGITDGNENDAPLTLPVPGKNGSISAAKSIIIDNTKPTQPVVSCSMDSALYGIDDVIFFTLEYNEKVYVTGDPKIEMTGTTDSAVYYSGSGRESIRFKYTVQEGDGNIADLVYSGTNVFSDANNYITDKAGNEVVYTLPAIPDGLTGADSNIVVDGKRATISSMVAALTDNAGGATYANLTDVVTFSITYNEVIEVTGTPKILLETGTRDRYATFTGLESTGTDTDGDGIDEDDVLLFTYNVVEGDESPQLNAKKTSSLSGGSIKDLAGNKVDLTLLASFGGTPIPVDAEIPAIKKVTSTSGNGTYIVGEDVVITVTFSEDVNYTTPTLKLNDGNANAPVDLTGGLSTGNTLSFTYTVSEGDNSSDLAYFDQSALVGTITDDGGNDWSGLLPTPGTRGSLSRNKSITIDGTTPIVDYVTSTNADGDYGIDDVLYIKVYFTEEVKVVGSPRLLLDINGPGKEAVYYSGSKSNALVFIYTIVSGDATGDLSYVNSGSLSLNGGYIYDYSGNDATLTLPNVGLAGSLSSNKAITITTAKSVTVNTDNSDNSSFGTTENSNVAEVTIQSNNPFISNEFAFNIYPNPVSENINIHFEGDEAEALIMLFDVTGNKVYTEKTLTKRSFSIENNFEAGVYFVTVICEGKQYTERIIINE